MHIIASDLEAEKAQLEEKASGLEASTQELLRIKEDQGREISRLSIELVNMTRTLNAMENRIVEENQRWRKAETLLQSEREARKDIESRLEAVAQAQKTVEAKLESEHPARTAVEAALKTVETQLEEEKGRVEGKYLPIFDAMPFAFVLA